jgi:hypothetical protein
MDRRVIDANIGSDVDLFFCERVFNMFRRSVQRSIDYARTNPGEEGILAALGLLCYTEVIGGFISGSWKPRKGRENFNAFFDRLGPEYELFRRNLPSKNPYDLFRCGLAHEGATKEPCRIRALKDTETCGVWKSDPGEGYVLSVEKYFEDFLEASRELYLELMARRDTTMPKRRPTIVPPDPDAVARDPYLGQLAADVAAGGADSPDPEDDPGTTATEPPKGKPQGGGS